jgi:hypothetical protein
VNPRDASGPAEALKHPLARSDRLDRVIPLTDRAFVARSRLFVAHADLGRLEWPGTRQLAEEPALPYGLALVAVSRPQGGKFPSPAVCFCTSDHQLGHRFRKELSLAEIQQALARGEQPGRLSDWTM